MYQGSYEKLKDAEAEQVFKKIESSLEGNPFSKPVIHRCEIPFYPGAFLHDVSDPEQYPAPHRFAIEYSNVFYILDGTNAPIYSLNKAVPLMLHEGTAADYIRFFLTFVTGQHGRFDIVESVDDIKWREEPPPNARRALSMMLQTIRPLVQSDGSFSCEATILFHESLYRSQITVSENGEVKLRNEEILVEDIPVIDSLFGH